MPRDEFLKLEGRQTVLSLRINTPKMAPSRSLGGKRTGGNSGGDSQHRGSETAMQLLSSIALADAAAL